MPALQRFTACDEGAPTGEYEIELRSRTGFPVRNELPTLRIAGRDFTLSHYPESGETTSLFFTLSAVEFGSPLPDGAELRLRYTKPATAVMRHARSHGSPGPPEQEPDPRLVMAARLAEDSLGRRLLRTMLRSVERI